MKKAQSKQWVSETGSRLRLLLKVVPKSRMTIGRVVVKEHGRLIQSAIRKGHSLRSIAQAVNLGPRTLQKYLSLAGIFFRKPRKKKGRVIRPYKARQKQAVAGPEANV
jgi:hypothetical protein